jgi:dipeptide/tripeptide permease
MLGLGEVTASNIVNALMIATSLTPMLAAIVADSFLGRYKTMVFAAMYVSKRGKLVILEADSRIELRHLAQLYCLRHLYLLPLKVVPLLEASLQLVYSFRLGLEHSARQSYPS